jgi:CubicO group peptidase (beta-lactamase class C family)
MTTKLLSAGINISLFCLMSQFVMAQDVTSVDNFILNYMNDHHLPGLAVSTIKNGKIAWTKGYGYADIDKDIPFTPNTINAEIASISKAVTATAIMKLWEQGRFNLDDPINRYLPFEIVNPHFPNNPITFRMLLLHTSSLNYDSIPDTYNYNFNTASTTSLQNDIHDYLVVGGIHYNPVYFNNYIPGSQWYYGGIDYEVLGYLVERISGISFNQFCRQNIFAPLCMNHTGWYFNEVDTNIVSRPYYYSNPAHKQNDYGFYETPDYPARQLKTTVVDLSRFLLMNMNYGILDGVRILDSTTVATIRTIGVTLTDNSVLKSGQGLGWFYFKIYHNPLILPDNSEVWGDDGGGDGVSTTMYSKITDNTGVIVFSNGEQSAFDHSINFYLWNNVLDTISTASSQTINCSYISTPCERPEMYWKTNSSQWASNAVPMKIGTKHYYTQRQTIDVLTLPSNGDASIVLTRALITAKLNIAQGSELSPVILTINAAMKLIGDKRIPFEVPVSVTSPTGVQMMALATTLNLYNAGLLNTTKCSEAASNSITSKTANDNTATSKYLSDGKTGTVCSLAAFPNPVSASATILFSLAHSENVTISIVDLSGRIIKTLINNELKQGSHQIEWDARSASGTPVLPGIYLIRIKTANYSETKRISVVR